MDTAALCSLLTWSSLPSLSPKAGSETPAACSPPYKTTRPAASPRPSRDSGSSRCPVDFSAFWGGGADFSGADPALSAGPGDAGAGAAAACPGCRIGLTAAMATGVAMAPRSPAGAAARRHGSTGHGGTAAQGMAARRHGMAWRHRACAACRGDSPLGRSRAVAVATGNPA